MTMHRPRILISVTNKTGVTKFGALIDHNWEIVSTGGTARFIQAAHIPVTLIEDVTGFPEMMNGRVKTLHPFIFGGILADRSKPEHMDAIEQHGIEPVDVVVVNLYDFSNNPSIEEIDIGGPSLIRAAAKNCAHVTVVVDPSDYDTVIDQLYTHGHVDSNLRQELALKVFDHTANYDRAIYLWMRDKLLHGESFSVNPTGTTH